MQGKGLFSLVIPRRSANCTRCAASLEPGTTVYSFVDGDDEAFQRFDLCPTCWKGESDSRSHWRAQVPQKKPSLRDLFLNRDERALSWFRTLGADQVAKRFVLALYLARRKRIALRKEVTKKGTLFQIYESADSEETFTVVRPELSVLEVSTLQKEIADYLLGLGETGRAGT